MKIRKYTPNELQNLLIACSKLFENNEKFSQPDSIILSAIKKFKGNQSLEVVLPKVIIINSFYSTQIYDTTKMANHIVELNIDGKLNSGDIALIDSIRLGHGVISNNSSPSLIQTSLSLLEKYIREASAQALSKD